MLILVTSKIHIVLSVENILSIGMVHHQIIQIFIRIMNAKIVVLLGR